VFIVSENIYLTKFKKLLKIIVLSLILIYASYLVVVANYSKEIFLMRNNISTSDIIFKYETDVSRHVDMETVDDARVWDPAIFLIYLKNDEEIGFIKMRSSDANILFPLIPFRAYTYSLAGKYVIDIKTGDAAVTYNNILKRGTLYCIQNPKEDNIVLHGTYSYLSLRLAVHYRSRYTSETFNVYMGIKHERDYVMMEAAIYKFIEYFDDIFDGIYVYFIVTDEWFERDYSLW